MIKKLWPSIVLAALGLTLLFTQFSFFQGHPASHNQAVIASYYIYDPVTGYATAHVTLYQDGCKITENMEPSQASSVSAVISIYKAKDDFVGSWICFADSSKTWHKFSHDPEDRLLIYSSRLVDDLLMSRNKLRPSEKFFLL